MHIVDKLKDYYDCTQATDEDRSLLYVRNREEYKWAAPNNPFCTMVIRVKTLNEVIFTEA